MASLKSAALVKGLDLRLTLDPPPASRIPAPFLTVAAESITFEAELSQIAPVSATGDALEIKLEKANLGGHVVSGDIGGGAADAGSGSSATLDSQLSP